MTLAIKRSPGSASRDAKKARAAQGEEAKPTARNERVPLVARTLPLGSLRRPQASSNTYPTGSAPRQQRAALRRLCTTFYERKWSMRRKRHKRNDRKPVQDGL